MLNISTATLENEAVQKTQRFDVVIAEWIISELYSGLEAVFKSPVEAHWMIVKLIDEMTNPAYNPDAISDELKQDLLKMFGSVKQTVLCKFKEDLPNKPSNVHILKWAPQQTHPNCILFIPHGDLLSTTETIYFGKPVIPVFGDQFANTKRAVRKGFAKRLDLSYDMDKILTLLWRKYYQILNIQAMLKNYHQRTGTLGGTFSKN